MKVFAVVAVWGNTKGNHAGMFYLANKLQERFAGKFVIIPTPTKGSRFFFIFINYIIPFWEFT